MFYLICIERTTEFLGRSILNILYSFYGSKIENCWYYIRYVSFKVNNSQVHKNCNCSI